MTGATDPGRFDSDALLQRYGLEESCGQYLDLLQKENRRANLVSRETSPEDLRRLAAESLLPLEFLPDLSPARYLDIGSGGGLPAIPLLLAWHGAGRYPERAVLVERRQKRASALRRLLIALDLRAEILVEDFPGAGIEGRFDLVTLRLVRLTPLLLQAMAPLLAPGGAFVHFASLSTVAAPSEWSPREYSFAVDGEGVTKVLTAYRRN